ncbi:serine/threonine-protein kinase [Nonomuraea cypriaca]|uniref:serine/threonine-protein kinase n=1 Tax=Nonomuraea cypriaca TaxID=1187855 RepID=UPI001A9C3828|nr:serine/threonine-protein kinase [Nonomuraea cypriaca]
MEWSAPGYTEVKQLGTGASGRVVLAVHDETGVKVAIKYLSGRLRRDPAALARFQSEARLLTTLRDPNIATIWEYVQDADGAAIVMELVNGVSLRALLRENGTTEPEAALVVLKGSLLGLARAHTAGLVHRDYKPENVIVRDDGISKLVDFGIAVRQGTAGQAEGTPPYMAPELWSGQPASPATDVYAATAVFFECLTGHRPYRSTEPSVLGYQHLHAPVPVHDAPEPVRRLVLRGLAKDPGRRPPSAQAFVAELESTARAAYGEDWEERGRRRLAALVALLALLLPTPEPPVPEVSTSLARTVFRGLRSNTVRVAATGVLAVAVTVAVVVVLTNRERPPAETIGAAAAVPPTELTSGPPTSPGSTQEGAPESTPETGPQSSPEAVVPAENPTGLLPPPPTTTEPTTTGPTTTGPTTTRPATTKPATTPRATRTPRQNQSGTPAETEPTTGPTTEPTTEPATDPTGAPAEPPADTPSPATPVLGVTVGGLTVGADGVARGTVTLRTGGTAPVTASAAWTAPGTNGHTQRVRLSGSTTYTRTLTWSIGERPCGRTVTLTVTTSPAAPGGARSASSPVPPCATRVTGLRVGLDLPDDGRTATARVRVTATGTGEIPVQAAFAVNGDTAATRTANLSGETSYTQRFTHAFRSRPCGATLSVVVRAGDRTATARTTVRCPAEVRQVSVLRAAAGEAGLTATVAVRTENTRPVRLDVTFSAGRVTRTQSVTLSGETSYTRTLRAALKLPCGTRWSVTAATSPAAGNGRDSASGRTRACPAEEEPEATKTPEVTKTPRPDTPEITKTPRPNAPEVTRTPKPNTSEEKPEIIRSPAPDPIG